MSDEINTPPRSTPSESSLDDSPCSLTLAERIAKRILTYNEQGDIGYRIAIKSGTWTEDHSQERDEGGLCHAAIINLIQEEINSANVQAQAPADDTPNPVE